MGARADGTRAEGLGLPRDASAEAIVSAYVRDKTGCNILFESKKTVSTEEDLAWFDRHKPFMTDHDENMRPDVLHSTRLLELFDGGLDCLNILAFGGFADLFDRFLQRSFIALLQFVAVFFDAQLHRFA